MPALVPQRACLTLVQCMSATTKVGGLTTTTTTTCRTTENTPHLHGCVRSQGIGEFAWSWPPMCECGCRVYARALPNAGLPASYLVAPDCHTCLRLHLPPAPLPPAGEKMSEEDIDKIIESGEAENVFKKAILDQGRG